MRIHLLEQKILQNPYDPDVLHALGTAYLEHGKYSAGLDCFRRITAVQPDSAMAHCSLGWALLHIGDIDGARNAYEKACRLAPRLPQAVSGKANVLYRLGDHKSAYKYIRKILDYAVDNQKGIVTAARIYAKICQEYGDCNEVVELLERILGNPEINDSSRISAGFALGDLYDRMKQFKLAFTSYQKANSLTKHQYSHDFEHAKNSMIMSAFSEETMANVTLSSNTSERPVFIVGMPRSGTSLIEQILARHPEVHAAGELNTITEIANILFSHCGYPGTLDRLDIEVLDKAAEHYLQQIDRLSSEAKKVTDKMPANFIHLGLIYLLFPKAHIIHAHRNPLDTCISIYFQTFGETHAYASDLRNIGLYYLEYTRMMTHWQSTLHMNIHDVNYEELVANQESVSRAMIEFCNLEWNDLCLDFHKSNRAVTTASHDQVNKPIYNTSINRWKNYEPNIAPLIEILDTHLRI